MRLLDLILIFTIIIVSGWLFITYTKTGKELAQKISGKSGYTNVAKTSFENVYQQTCDKIVKGALSVTDKHIPAPDQLKIASYVMNKCKTNYLKWQQNTHSEFVDEFEKDIGNVVESAFNSVGYKLSVEEKTKIGDLIKRDAVLFLSHHTSEHGGSMNVPTVLAGGDKTVHQQSQDVNRDQHHDDLSGKINSNAHASHDLTGYDDNTNIVGDKGSSRIGPLPIRHVNTPNLLAGISRVGYVASSGRRATNDPRGIACAMVGKLMARRNNRDPDSLQRSPYFGVLDLLSTGRGLENDKCIDGKLDKAIEEWGDTRWHDFKDIGEQIAPRSQHPDHVRSDLQIEKIIDDITIGSHLHLDSK